MKKIVLALAAVAAVAAPIAISGGNASAAPDNSTLNCTNWGGGNNRCTATDPDGINYIRIINPTTGAEIKAIDFDCSSVVTKRGFNFSDDGYDNYRVRVADCTNATDTHHVTVQNQLV